MFPRAQLNILYLILTFFTALSLVSSRSVAVSPNNEAKNTEGQVGSKTKQLLHQQNNDVIAAHVRPPLGAVCVHVQAPLASRPRIKMASFYVCCDELHDLPLRYAAGEKRSLDVRAHL